MCCVALGHMKVLVRSSWDQQCWPNLVCAQVQFVYRGYQHDFALGSSLLPGNVSTEDKAGPFCKAWRVFLVQNLQKVFLSSRIFCSFLPSRIS